MLLLVGAVPAWVKSLTWGLLPYIAALTLMTIAMVLLWRYRARSIVGRLYYTALVVTGWGMCIVLLRTGLLQHCETSASAFVTQEHHEPCHEAAA